MLGDDIPSRAAGSRPDGSARHGLSSGPSGGDYAVAIVVVVVLYMSEVFNFLAGRMVVVVVVPIVGACLGGLLLGVIAARDARRTGTSAVRPKRLQRDPHVPFDSTTSTDDRADSAVRKTAEGGSECIDSLATPERGRESVASDVSGWLFSASMWAGMPSSIGARAAGLHSTVGGALGVIQAACLVGLMASLVTLVGAMRWRRRNS